MSTLRAAAVGAGYFSQYHFEAWRRIEEVRLVAVCALEGAEDAAARFDIQEMFADAADMLDAVKPDLFDIITPPATHLGMVRLAAERDIAAVCQMPLAPTLEEAEEPYALDRRGFGGDCVYRLQRHVVDHLIEGTEAVNTGREYLANLRIEEAVYESDATRRRIELTGNTS